MFEAFCPAPEWLPRALCRPGLSSPRLFGGGADAQTVNKSQVTQRLLLFTVVLLC